MKAGNSQLEALVSKDYKVNQVIQFIFECENEIDDG